MLAELDRVLRYTRFRKIHDLSDIEIEDFVQSVQQVALVIDVEEAKSDRVTRIHATLGTSAEANKAQWSDSRNHAPKRF